MDSLVGRMAALAAAEAGASEAAMDTGDWRNGLQHESRQRIVNKIMETLKRHLTFFGPEGVEEIKRISIRFEAKIYTSATSQTDYLRKISLKMLTMESQADNTKRDEEKGTASKEDENKEKVVQILRHAADNSEEYTKVQLGAKIGEALALLEECKRDWKQVIDG